MFTWTECVKNDLMLEWPNDVFSIKKECIEDAKKHGHKAGETILIGIIVQVFPKIDIDCILEQVSNEIYQEIDDDAAENWDIFPNSTREKEIYLFKKKVYSAFYEYLEKIRERTVFNKIENYYTTEIPGEDKTKLCIDPEHIKEIDNLYYEKCKEVNRLKKFEPPCEIGDIFYSIIEDLQCETPPYYITSQGNVIDGVVLKTDGWYIIDKDCNVEKIGSDSALLTINDAEKRLDELRIKDKEMKIKTMILEKKW